MRNVAKLRKARQLKRSYRLRLFFLTPADRALILRAQARLDRLRQRRAA
jgi:hypothetical protein